MLILCLLVSVWDPRVCDFSLALETLFSLSSGPGPERPAKGPRSSQTFGCHHGHPPVLPETWDHDMEEGMEQETRS